jgi:hypothetical protein
MFHRLFHDLGIKFIKYSSAYFSAPALPVVPSVLLALIRVHQPCQKCPGIPYIPTKDVDGFCTKTPETQIYFLRLSV